MNIEEPQHTFLLQEVIDTKMQEAMKGPKSTEQVLTHEEGKAPLKEDHCNSPITVQTSALLHYRVHTEGGVFTSRRHARRSETAKANEKPASVPTPSDYGTQSS
ncbi:hypothetical protein GN956_G10433 [Arapaima gigas]